MSESELKQELQELENRIDELKNMSHKLYLEYQKAQGPTLSAFFSIVTGRIDKHHQNVSDEFDEKEKNIQREIQDLQKRIQEKRLELRNVQWQKN